MRMPQEFKNMIFFRYSKTSMDEALKLEKIDGFFEWKKNSGLSLSLCAFGNEMNFAPLPPPPSTYLLDRNVRSHTVG